MYTSSLELVGTYAGALVFLQLLMSLRAIMARRKSGVGFGWDDNEDLARVVRAHGNFIEYVPLTLIVMLLLALSGTGAWLLHMIGTLLLAGRVLHAAGLYKSWLSGRVFGMLATWAAMAIAGILALRALL